MSAKILLMLVSVFLSLSCFSFMWEGKNLHKGPKEANACLFPKYSNTAFCLREELFYERFQLQRCVLLSYLINADC